MNHADNILFSILNWHILTEKIVLTYFFYPKYIFLYFLDLLYLSRSFWIPPPHAGSTWEKLWTVLFWMNSCASFTWPAMFCTSLSRSSGFSTCSITQLVVCVCSFPPWGYDIYPKGKILKCPTIGFVENLTLRIGISLLYSQNREYIVFSHSISFDKIFVLPVESKKMKKIPQGQHSRHNQ